MRFLDLKKEVFGLDLNDLSLKIVKLKNKRRGFALASFNEVRVAPGVIDNGEIKKEKVLSRIIKYACQTAKGKKIKTKYVVASLPEEKSFLQVIQMPKMTEEELKLAVPLEAENYIPMPVDEAYLDFQVVPPVKKDYINYMEVLIVAIPKKIVDSYVSCIKKAGLIPLVLEPESEAIARALIKKETKSVLSILIDFGEDNTDFVVFSGHSIRFTCSIPISSQSLTKAISESLKVNFHEAEKLKIEYGLVGRSAEKVPQIIAPIIEDLAGQIKKYINFYHEHSSFEYLFPEGKTEKILLCGGGVELRGLADFLSKKLEIPVELGNPFINFSPKKYRSIINKNQTAFTTAIGLALRPIDDNL